jgi:hypothetical protein
MLAAAGTRTTRHPDRRAEPCGTGPLGTGRGRGTRGDRRPTHRRPQLEILAAVTGSRSSLSLSPSRGRRGSSRPLAILLGVLLTAVALWALVVGVVWIHAWLQLGPADVPALTDEEAALGAAGATAPDDATTVLVVLTEERDPTVPREPALVGSPVLVQTGGSREGAAALILPPELPVMVEGEGERSLAQVQAAGGADLLVRTLTDHTGVRIDHVVSATSDLLPRLVDELGPLEVCTSAGCARPTAAELRAELAVADDRDRVRLTVDVLRAVGDELGPAWAVAAPVEAWRLTELLASNVRTDASLRPGELFAVADALATETLLEVDHLPLVVNPQTDAVVPLLEPAQVRYEHLRQGTSFAGVDGEAEEEDLLRGVEVAVLNGAGVDGLAGQVQVLLEASGFRVVGTGNAPSFGRDATTIAYREDDPIAELAAVRLAELLEGAQLDPLARDLSFEGDPVDVQVIVGADRIDG